MSELVKKSQEVDSGDLDLKPLNAKFAEMLDIIKSYDSEDISYLSMLVKNLTEKVNFVEFFNVLKQQLEIQKYNIIAMKKKEYSDVHKQLHKAYTDYLLSFKVEEEKDAEYYARILSLLSGVDTVFDNSKLAHQRSTIYYHKAMVNFREENWVECTSILLISINIEPSDKAYEKIADCYKRDPDGVFGLLDS